MGPGPDGPMGHLPVIWDQDQMDQWDHLGDMGPEDGPMGPPPDDMGPRPDG